MLLSTFSLSALPDDPVDPDKSDYSLFDPTPDDQMRSFSTDRPPKANPPTQSMPGTSNMRPTLRFLVTEIPTVSGQVTGPSSTRHSNWA